MGARGSDRTVPTPDRIAPRWRLVYAHGCGVCRVIAAAVLRLDRHRRLVPVALEAGSAADLLARVPPARRERSWHLVAPDGTVQSAGAAIPPLCALLPGFGGLGRLCGAAPDLTERVYAWLVRHRAAIGRGIPDRVVASATVLLAARGERI